jgi:hypothetical protein
MVIIDDALDLDEAKSQRRAIVFLWVDFAIEARRSEVAVKHFLFRWALKRPDIPIADYRVDLSSQSGEPWRSVRAWLDEQNQQTDSLTYSGTGVLLWVKSGQIVQAIPNAGLPNVDRDRIGTLETLTVEVFGRE